jgi:transcriptional regulator with GAF, ATPase, and Fis domain
MNVDFLKDVALAVAQEQHLETVMKTIVEGISQEPDVALVRLWFLAPGDICAECYLRRECPDQTRCLHLVASAGHPLNEHEDWSGLNGAFGRIPFGVGKVGFICKLGESIFIPNLSVDQRWVRRPEWVKREAIRSFAGHPLKFREAVLGVLGVFSRAQLSEDDFSWLHTFADSAAVAITNARRFEEIDRLRAKLELENEYLQAEIKEVFDFGEIVGQSPALKNVLQQIQLVAGTNATVLILGESGTGKELIARAVHERSSRRQRQFIKVNCAAIPDNLFESEFFGHVKGAFTGADKDRVGRVQVADGGTLFLDEIAEIPVGLQAKLLQVLQEQQFERVGENHWRKVDVRIIAATNRNLEKEIEAGHFRNDLFYRLNVFPVEVPPLRERREDVPLLAAHFLKMCAKKMNIQPPKLTKGNIERLQAYDWPGNVRELQNVIERAAIFAQTGALRFDFLRLQGSKSGRSVDLFPSTLRPDPTILTDSELKQRERESIIAALAQANGKISGPRGAAELLGMKPTTLASRIKALGLKAGLSERPNRPRFGVP